MAVKNITKENFDLLNQSGTVLIDFFADWCGPCKMLSPIISELAEEYKEITVGKVNVDIERELAQKFQVMSIPTLIVLKNGVVVDKKIGFQSKNQIAELLL